MPGISALGKWKQEDQEFMAGQDSHETLSQKTLELFLNICANSRKQPQARNSFVFHDRLQQVKTVNWEWWHRTVILALVRWKQEDQNSSSSTAIWEV